MDEDYNAYMAPVQQRLPWGYEIYNFGICIPFLGHLYYTLSLSDPDPGAEKIFFKEIHQFYTYLPLR